MAAYSGGAACRLDDAAERFACNAFPCACMPEHTSMNSRAKAEVILIVLHEN